MGINGKRPIFSEVRVDSAQVDHPRFLESRFVFLNRFEYDSDVTP